MGYTPKVEWPTKQSPLPTVETRLTELDKLREEAATKIIEAQGAMKKRNKGNTNYKPFKEGAQVWLEGKNLKTPYPSAKLGPKRQGPFTIMKQLSLAVYQLKLPPQWKIHNVFHANLLTPYKETELYGPNFTRPLPDLIDGEEEYEVEKILDAQPRGRGRKLHYLIKWKGYPTSDNSWEPAAHVHAEEAIAEFQKRSSKPNKTKRKKL
jgi:hypothetical protein